MRIIIVGGGLIGLSTGYQILKDNPSHEVVVLEKETAVAQHQSGSNSGVIHTGVYYRPGSLKAKNCVAGREELLKFCNAHDVPYRTLPKLIVATSHEEKGRLKEIKAKGEKNGVPGLKIISREEAFEYEPHVTSVESLLVPNCGIISFQDVANRLVETSDFELKLGVKVLQIEGQRVMTNQGEEQGDLVINCAGLFSDALARKYLAARQHPFRILPFRGEYYHVTRNLVNGLIYPVPNPKFPFLGVHLTKRMDDTIEAGPNAVLAFAREGYTRSKFNLSEIFDYLSYQGFWALSSKHWKVGCYEVYRSLRKKVFLRDLQRLVPSIEEEDLSPGGAGVRAQVVGKDGRLIDDFVIEKEGDQIHVLNAPSPAATSCLAIGRHIANQVQG